MNERGGRHRWSRGEKVMILGAILSILVTAGLGMWWSFESGDPVVKVPTPSMPSPNGYNLLVAAANQTVYGWPMSGATRPSTGGKWVQTPEPIYPDLYDPATMAAAKKLLIVNSGALSSAKSALPYPYLCPPTRSLSQSFRPISKLNTLSCAMALQAYVYAHQHNFDSFVSSALFAVQMGNEIPRGGSLLCRSVGFSCERNGRLALWKYVGVLDQSQCRQLIAGLDCIDATSTPTADSLTEEKWAQVAILQEWFRKPKWQSTILNPGNQPVDARLMGDEAVSAMTGKRRVLANYMARMDSSIAAARRPYGTEATLTPSDPITYVLAPRADEAIFDGANNQLQNRLLMTVAALRSYKLDHAAYPSTLTQLMPEYLRAVPVDPFTTASPVLYRRTGKTFILYSVGPDMRDDGGTPIYAPTKEGLAHNSMGDIVAGVNGY